MKLSQLNQNEATAIKLINYHYNSYVGGLENTMLDNEENSKEYIDAKNELSNPARMVEIIYNEILSTEGATYSKQIRFCGAEWIKERIARHLKKDGYYDEYQKRPEYDLKARS